MTVVYKPIDTSYGMISDDLISRVLSEYGFDSSWIILPLTNVNECIIAFNRRSETARKVIFLLRNKVYILKEIPWYCSTQEFVEFELSFQTYLHRKNIPMPKIIPTKNNMLWVKEMNRYYYLQEYIEGYAWKKSLSGAEKIGSILAELHTASSKWKSAPTGLGCENILQPARNILSVLRKFIGNNKANLSDDMSSLLDKYINICSKKLAKVHISTGDESYNSLLLYVHGDFNPWNIIFDSNGDVAGITDFDNACFDNPVHDIAECLVDYCFMQYRPYSTRFEKVPHEFDQDLAFHIIKGYREVNEKMFQSTIKFLPSAVTAIFIELCSLGLLRGDFDHSESVHLLSSLDILEESIYNLICHLKHI